MRRVGLGESDFEQKSRELPTFRAAWVEIEGRLRSEGADASTMDLAKDGFVHAYQQLGSDFQVKGEEAIEKAKNFVLVSKTVAGAIGTVQGLVETVQSGAPPAALANAFAGAMVGAAVAAGAVSAGAGAAIVAGIGLIFSVAEKVGIFGPKRPPGVEICPGTFCNPAPSFVLDSCICVWGDTVWTPSSVNWRPFPEPATDPYDASVWLYSEPVSGRSVFEWHGAKFQINGGWNQRWSHVFPGELSQLERDLGSNKLVGVPGEFERAFFAAWKINKAYAFNGLSPAENWRVLSQTLRMWNASREPGGGYAFLQNGSRFVETVVRQLANHSRDEAPGGVVRINTGPIKSIKPLNLSAISTMRSNISERLGPGSGEVKTSSALATVAKGTAVVGVLGAGAIYLYARSAGMTFTQAAAHLFKRGKSAVGLRENVFEENPVSRGRGRAIAAKQAWMRAYEEAIVRLLGARPNQIDWDTAIYLYNEGLSPEAAAQQVYQIKSNPRARGRARRR